MDTAATPAPRGTDHGLRAEILLLMLPVSLASWVVTEYRQFRFIEVLSFQIYDSWCTDGLGIHCFGDYSFFVVNGLNQSETFYTALGQILLIPFLEISRASEELGLAAYIITMTVIAILSGAVAVSMRSQSGVAPQPGDASAQMVVWLASTPLVMSLDRGNNVLFIVPLLLFLMKSFEKDGSGQALIFAALILIRPQMAALSLIFLAERRAAPAVLGGVVALAAQLTWIFCRGLSLGDWITSVASLSGRPRVEGIGWERFGLEKSASFGGIFRSLYDPPSEVVLGLNVVLLSLVVCLMLTVWHRRNEARELMWIDVSWLAILVYPDAPFYYLTVPAIAYIVAFSSKRESARISRSRRGHMSRSLGLLSAVSVLTPVLIPAEVFGLDRSTAPPIVLASFAPLFYVCWLVSRAVDVPREAKVQS